MSILEEKEMLSVLSVNETQSTNGGFWGFVIGAIVGGFIYDCISEPGDCIDGFRDGMNEGLK